MKPRVKNDSWCYTTSKRAAREKVKRLANKRHRRDNKKIINGETKSPRISFSERGRYRTEQEAFRRFFELAALYCS